MKTLVIAGNHFEATQWIKKDCERRFTAGDTSVSMSQYVYVHDATQIRGIQDPHGVFIGSWRERKDIKELVNMLLQRSFQGNRNLERIRKELK